MLWIVLLFVFVYLLFQDSCQTCQDELEGQLAKDSRRQSIIQIRRSSE